jgi:dethiobiotin synthetase
MGRLIVVSGTGTEIGKTHVSEALLRAVARVAPRVAGIKPVESGVTDAARSDAARLAAASTFHVKHPSVALREAISPHRAARHQGIQLDLASLAEDIQGTRAEVDVLLVELPGGLFTPLSDEALNVHLASLLQPDWLLLVGPDRLGVLHDVLSTLRAAESLGVTVTAVVLVAPEQRDASTGTNAAELARFVRVPVLPTVRRATATDLANDPAIAVMARAALGSRPAHARV